MQVVIAIVKPNKVEAVKTAVTKLGVLGMTAIECKGFGKQMGHGERYRGPKMDVGFVPKVLVMLCVKDSEKDAVVTAIAESAKTGSVGDGKVFVVPLAEAMRIRTGEIGDLAL